ncbi:hypothetical protein LR48_Vigan561s000200 [Vigna angularis]|uniref:Uncharacterized protein n=1 Tax=Phaseolus angularis TaxID=3914 RepID=A0A0L9TDM2_PHAAN|nr:uncharacterized protein HKW66_Vig0100360 [Vigna angularis]KOM28612.1 hypothetical protein LR48_Vigan561s000200 [Vigna angularis]
MSELSNVKPDIYLHVFSTQEQNEQKLRKAVSDVSSEIEKYYSELKLERQQLGAIEEVEQAECQCCGLKEDCTSVYITEVEECYCGKWVCGLCSEAVKERVGPCPTTVAMQDALNSHRDFCQEYNATRLNPQLSLTHSMREIAKRSFQNRKSKLTRTTSYP